ncbi:MAG TPA: hypothetical protein VGN99_12295 [Steroidobacteraceae bacterium]|nr:hypothetical protein [Steroidobacteraceae bacterium]
MQSVLHRALLMGVGLLVTAGPVVGDAAPQERLSFDVEEGPNLNSFLREGPVAAHLLLRSGLDPRILVAFPAGNSGVGLWFAHGGSPLTWTLRGRPQPLIDRDAKGRPLYGMKAEVSVTGVSDLIVKQAVLSSVRVLRDYQALGTFPAEVAAHATIQGSTITWARDRLDGAAGYRLSIEVTAGTLRADHFTAAKGGITLKITAVSGETPLTPLPEKRLLTDRARNDPAARNVLTFLSYKEKFLAGSWRFNTYFGRDTLMSLRLLMPALAPEAVDAGLGAVLTRLSAQGEVAHEEDIGEFAILDHLRANGEKSDAPTFNYNMIDGSFMLAPVAAQWLLNDERGRTQAAAFLKRMDDRRDKPQAMGADLVANLRFVLHAALKFADDPRAPNLIALKQGFDAGEWRDSNDGLGGGRIPYDVNAVFVPAALEAAAGFFTSGLLDSYLEAADRALFGRAATMARTWRSQAGPLFDVSVPNATARQKISEYAAALHVADATALGSVDSSPVSFHALSLTADDKPIAIVHSDEGFELLFGRPAPATLDRSLTALMRPFPAGLITSVGIVVANPVYTTPAIQARLNRSAYHGTVVWSWQQAVFAAGLQRQLQRDDLSPPLKAHLRSAQKQLWSAINAGHSMRNSELWSWSFADGHYAIAPFGASAADADESNAAQLWSTVYLAIPPP